MKVLLAVAFAVFAAGCIDWRGAEHSYCNVALLEERYSVCGHRVTSAGNDSALTLFSPIKSMNAHSAVATHSGAWIFGALLEPGPAYLGLQRFDGYGAAGELLRFGERPNSWMTQSASLGESLIVGGQFTEREVVPGGGVVTTLGALDVYLALVDPTGTAAQVRTLGATAGSMVTVNALATGGDSIVISGVLRGQMNIENHLIESDSGTFLLVLDATLSYRWHALTPACGGSPLDLSRDGLSVDPAGGIVISARATTYRNGDPEPCTIFGTLPPEESSVSITARLDAPSSGTGPTVRWHATQVDANPASLSSLSDSAFLAVVRPSDRPETRIERRDLRTGEVLSAIVFLTLSGIAVERSSPGTAWLQGSLTAPRLFENGIALGPLETSHRVAFQVDASGLAVWAETVFAVDESGSLELRSVAGNSSGQVWMVGSWSGAIQLRDQQLQAHPSGSFVAAFQIHEPS